MIHWIVNPPNVPIVQRPRTWPFQGQNAGSNPAGDANTETAPSLAVVPEAADAVLAGTLSTGSR